MAIASKTPYELHHNFPKLADESGFAFNLHRPRMHVDWNKIKLIDIETLIRERKFVLIEQHVNDILNCVLESEFDVRILNEGVLKMFRLAQLAVEYQQFCRHYLDRSVYVLKEEISALIQELDVTKKDLRDKEEEIKKLRRKTKHSYRTPLPYGNDNIATMILKTLTNKGDLFPSTSNADTHQYNKCSYCDKVFLNQLYLQSHISRRHSNLSEIPQKDVPEKSNINPENTKMNEEIKELKEKLKLMEAFITESKQTSQNIPMNVTNVSDISKATTNTTPNSTENTPKKMKDAEASTNNEEYLLDKIEEWKKEEYEKYNREITLLRTQIMETINSFKEKEKDTNSNTSKPDESNIINQLHKTIREQGAEILTLKQELNKSRLIVENDNAQRRKESEEQMAIWANRMEAQSKQYELLLQKLNNVAKEAQESKLQAVKEKERVQQLEVMLQESINRNSPEDEDSDQHIPVPINQKHINNKILSKSSDTPNKKNTVSVSSPTPELPSNYKTLSDQKTLERLHQKAKELLNIESMSSSSSEVSSLEHPPVPKQKLDKSVGGHSVSYNPNKRKANKYTNKTVTKKTEKKSNNLLHGNKIHSNKQSKRKEENVKKDKSEDIEKNGPVVASRSPMKVVRAKITEEVNSRLASAGMDPLKSRLPKNVFQKQRLLLQQQNELKSKKNPKHEKVRHSILAYLDSSISKKDNLIPDDYVSPEKVGKTFSISSVLSNVKSKALSLVKSNEVMMKNKRKNLSAEVTKRAMSLLKTPPGSADSSPAIQKHSPTRTNESNTPKYDDKSESVVKEKPKKLMTSKTTIVHKDSDSESSNSDNKNYKTISQQSSKSIEHLIKSPARRPASANTDYSSSNKYSLNNGDVGLTRTQSAINISSTAADFIKSKSIAKSDKNIQNLSSDGEESPNDEKLRKINSEENIQNIKQTKGVLKNASSASSLNKKKVLFDMDAIQMKSVSASPSQSFTEKSDGNEKYELGLINLDGEEWDISSIENEPLKNDTKIQINTRTSPKISELKKTIESQLARRNDMPSTIRVGGVDVLGGPMTKGSSVGGSNTSLGSSILDDSDHVPVTNHRAFVKSKSIVQKDDSELDLSEFSIDGLGNNKNESF